MLAMLLANLDDVTKEIKEKIVPENIREGVEIFGIQGALPSKLTQHKHISAKTYPQLITADEGYNGFHDVIVEPVTYTIDSDIVPANIRYGKNVLGIDGALSSLTEDEYNEMLLLEYDILGYTEYVTDNTLVLSSDDSSVENGVLVTAGTVDNGTLKID